MTLASLGPYVSFIVTSYLLVGLVVAGLVVWIRLDYKRQKQILRDLEARGVAAALAEGVTAVDYTGFVDLVAEHTNNQTWL